MNRNSSLYKLLRSFPEARGVVAGARAIRHWCGTPLRWRRFIHEFRQFSNRSAEAQTHLSVRWRDRYPCLHDRTPTTGFEHHYVYHTAWAARVLAETRPDLHIDIASSLYLIGVLSAFIPVKFFDYRPADLRLSNLNCEPGDLLNLPFRDRSVASLSCLHVLEHVGLARYGDPLDPEGDRKAMSELSRVLAPGGNLLVAMPVGRPCVRFNAHRIYSYEMIRDAFGDLTLKQFSLIPDSSNDGLIIDAPPELVREQEYGCGCFWFQRPVEAGRGAQQSFDAASAGHAVRNEPGNR